ncbi:MAG: 1-acyl-sn-glycerol-3-phosphate acyltransferase [Acidobacteria bacterium]|nr:MAG: 1-acyl-sn-glycerol-3-phosphate acyltransferase [Acidobacteriota bacterium]
MPNRKRQRTFFSPHRLSLRKLYLIIRSLVLWTLSIIHFFPICTLLVIIGVLFGHRRTDRLQRLFFRNILRLAGVKFQVRYAPGFDPTRTSFFVCNHVNIFDAFVIYSAIPQFVRGLELESHFKIPGYGWMMKYFGNIPVSSNPSPAELRDMMRRVKRALAEDVSLIVFAEGTRTRDGRVGPFKRGVFAMAIQLGYPIVPMSIVGSYQFNRKGSWMLHPSTITVYIHDTIDTKGMTKEDVDALRDRVHRIVAEPVDQSLQTFSH